MDDRENVKAFDVDGNLLHIWNHYDKPSGLFIDRHDILYANDGPSSMVRSSLPDNWPSNLGWKKSIRIGELTLRLVLSFLKISFERNLHTGETNR